jgi:hypothetical protein
VNCGRASRLEIPREQKLGRRKESLEKDMRKEKNGKAGKEETEAHTISYYPRVSRREDSDSNYGNFHRSIKL